MLYSDGSSLNVGQNGCYSSLYLRGDTVYLYNTAAGNPHFGYYNQPATSKAYNLNAGAGLSIEFDLKVPAGYAFAGIYSVTCNHNIACSIGRFSYSSSNGKATVNVTNRSSTNYTDLTVSMGVHFIRPIVYTDNS
jgi:hypothetical protein